MPELENAKVISDVGQQEFGAPAGDVVEGHIHGVPCAVLARSVLDQNFHGDCVVDLFAND